MRVAVCLSGQLRQWHLGAKNQKWFWTTLNRNSQQVEVEVDYFAHTWDYSWDREGVSQEYIEREVNEQELQDFKNTFQLKSFEVDKRKQDSFRGNDHWSALFYSLSKSILQKKKYELDNNFKYDVVVKSRPDVVFNPHNVFAHPRLYNNVIFSTHGSPMKMEFDMFNVNDCVFYGNSYTMDLIPNLYFYRQFGIQEDNIENYRNIHPLGPGTLMNEYFKDYGVHAVVDSQFHEILLKEGCPTDLDLLELKDFNIMKKYFSAWYGK
tara:strand:+ start:2796 stop:3590 length:795 start_codon:yes stop_codon:yes gene_type:complete